MGRLKSPTDPALIGVGVLRAGEGYNIVAREAVIEGTVRCFSEETRAMINGKIADTARGVAALYNTTAEIETESFTMKTEAADCKIFVLCPLLQPKQSRLYI